MGLAQCLLRAGVARAQDSSGARECNGRAIRTVPMANDPDGRLNYAADLIRRCESDLKCTLMDGQRRDLLMNNTTWERSFIVRCVEYLRGPL